MIVITDREFHELADYIYRCFGIQLRDEKRPLVMGRLHQVLVDRGMDSFSDYVAYLKADRTGEAVRTLLDRITTNHTFFMREPQHFTFFRDSVLPELERKVRDKDMRIWSAGCSSGEEPYTLAMVIDECFKQDKLDWNTQILATDIAKKVLDKAASGIYPSESLRSIPAAWRLRYFKDLGDGRSVVVDKLRKEVIFRSFNLMEPSFPFRKKFHVIFCRNVMIYFDTPTRLELVRKFYEHTESGGYLFIGHSESLPREEIPYSYVRPAVYRKE